MPELQKVAVIGLGYIGLPTAALIASRGMQVVGIDTKEHVVRTVASGRDSHLRARSRRTRAEGRVERRADDVDQAGARRRLHDRGADPDRRRESAGPVCVVNAAVESIRRPARARQPRHPRVRPSPIGTTEEIARQIGERRPDLHVGANGKEGGAVPSPTARNGCCPAAS